MDTMESKFAVVIAQTAAAMEFLSSQAQKHSLVLTLVISHDSISCIVYPGFHALVDRNLFPKEVASLTNFNIEDIVPRPSNSFSNEPFLEVLGQVSCPSVLSEAVDSARRALVTGISKPELVEEGLSGIYYLRNVENRVVGVFKASDEEGPYSPKNDKVFFGQDSTSSTIWRRGVPVGTAWRRERAAYLLDHSGLAGVPPTTVVEIAFKQKSSMTPGLLRQEGSFQLFMDGISTDDIGPSGFPVSKVHAIGLLDLRMLNTDRHAGNLLWNEKTRDLVPIDHGLALPEYPHYGDIWFCWMSWPQAKVPFDRETVDYVNRLDVDYDCAVLGNLNLGEKALVTLKMGTLLVKLAVSAGLTLYEIGRIVCSSGLRGERSVLEELCENCERSSSSKIGSTVFWDAIKCEISRVVSQWKDRVDK